MGGGLGAGLARFESNGAQHVGVQTRLVPTPNRSFDPGGQYMND